MPTAFSGERLPTGCLRALPRLHTLWLSGPFCVWNSKGAVEAVAKMYGEGGRFETPANVMTSSDLSRLINSDEIQTLRASWSPRTLWLSFPGRTHRSQVGTRWGGGGQGRWRGKERQHSTGGGDTGGDRRHGRGTSGSPATAGQRPERDGDGPPAAGRRCDPGSGSAAAAGGDGRGDDARGAGRRGAARGGGERGGGREAAEEGAIGFWVWGKVGTRCPPRRCRACGGGATATRG